MTKKSASVNTNKNNIKIIINNDSKKRKRKSKKQLAKSKFRTPLGTPSQPASQGVVSSTGLIPRIIPRGVSVGSTGLLDDYSTLAREYNNPVKITPKDVETPTTTKSKPEETTIKKLMDATASEKADLMALSLAHLRTAIKGHHPTITHRELRSINKSNKETYIDDLFGFPPARPVAGEARKRYSDIDDSDEDQQLNDVPIRSGSKTPRFQGQRPSSASAENFEGGGGASSGSGFRQPEDEERRQAEFFDSLPQDLQNDLNGGEEQDDFVYVPLPPKQQQEQKEDSRKLFKERLASRRQEDKDQGLDPNVSTRPLQFDLPISSNRRDPFEDATPSSGASPFLEGKATSNPVRPNFGVSFAQKHDEKRQEEEGAKVESHNDILLSATNSASKATPPRHSDNNPKTPSQNGRPLKTPRQFPLETPFDISVVSASAPFSPARKPTRKGSSIPQPVATIEAPKKGRPIGSKNKVPNSQSIVGNELNSQSIVGNVFG